MYSQSINVFAKLLPTIAMVLGAEVFLLFVEEMMTSSSGLMFVRTLIWSYLAYAAHAEFLLQPTRDKSEDNKRVFSFALRAFGLSLLPLIPAVYAVFKLLPKNATSADIASNGAGFLLAIVLVISISLLLVFALLGTILPAFVADHGRGIGAALSRGVSQFFWTVGKLITGPSVIMVITTLLAIGASLLIDGNGKLLGPNYFASFLTLTSGVFVNAIFALGTIMTAWVLSSAYKRSYNDEI